MDFVRIAARAAGADRARRACSAAYAVATQLTNRAAQDGAGDESPARRSIAAQLGAHGPAGIIC